MKTTKTLDALVFLTDEEDENSYGYIADAIVAYGKDAIPLLKRKMSLSSDMTQYYRIESLIYLIEQNEVIDKLRRWHSFRRYDLLEPYFIFSRYRFPQADWDMIGFHLMMIVEQAEQEFVSELTPLEQVKVLNHIIYGVNGFKGDKVSVTNPDYYFVNTLFDTRVGNPFSLGLLYIIVAQRLGLPIYGICLPYHFVLAYCKETRHFPQLEDVLFYINPFNDGVALTRKDIRCYLNRLGVKSELKYFEPANNDTIIKELFNTLIDTYFVGGKYDEANELRELMNY